MPTELRPAARLFGRFEPPEGAVLPTAGRLQALSCRESEGFPALAPTESFPVSIDEDGRWDVLIPGECAAARLTAGDFTPIFVERLRLPIRAERDLGIQRLSYAALVLFRAVRSPSGAPLAGAEAHAVAEDDIAEVARRIFAGERFASPSSVKTDHEGWARLGDLPAGLFHLLVTSPATPPFFSSSFEIRERTEAFLGDVEIPENAALTVRLDVTAESLHALRGVHVDLRPIGTEHWMEKALLQAAAEGADTVHFPSVPPGAWRILARAIDSRSQYPAGTVEVELRPGALEEITIPSQIAAAFGEVLYRSAPLEATLAFWPHERDGRPPVHTATFADGTFELLLTPGEYRVQVTAVDGSVRRHVPSVTFEASGDYLRLELPDGVVWGVVINGDGALAAGAHVTAERVEEPRDAGEENPSAASSLSSFALTDAEGRFEMAGLPAGTWHLTASAGDAKSVPTAIEVIEDQAASLTLRLEAPFVSRGWSGGKVVGEGRGPAFHGFNMLPNSARRRLSAPFPPRHPQILRKSREKWHETEL